MTYDKLQVGDLVVYRGYVTKQLHFGVVLGPHEADVGFYRVYWYDKNQYNSYHERTLLLWIEENKSILEGKYDISG